MRTNGNWMVGGRTYGREKVGGDPKKFRFKWEAYAFDLKSAESLKNDFTPYT